MIESIFSKTQKAMQWAPRVITRHSATTFRSSPGTHTGIGETVHSIYPCFRICHETTCISRNYVYADSYYSLNWSLKSSTIYCLCFMPFFSNFWYQILKAFLGFFARKKVIWSMNSHLKIVTTWLFSPWGIFKVLFKTKGKNH